MAAVAARSAAGSLPLMGIGNAGAAPRPPLRPPPHYPSWGSETDRQRCQDETDETLITPHGDRKPALDRPPGRPGVGLITPHGDRKPFAVDVPPRRPPPLITPHGDRKQISVRVTETEYRRSLPLMGIGNQPVVNLGARPRYAHYPSWGSETAAPPAPRRRRRIPHYPSWGSETRSATAYSGEQRNTHYPSWGSETAPVVRPSSARRRAHYPSWGSETRASGAGMLLNLLQLITPHGDRKPRSEPTRAC